MSENIELAIRDDNIDNAKKLFFDDKQKRNIVNAKYTDINNTLMHFAAKHNDADFLTELINSGADVNSQNANGDTPLHIALDNTTECKYTACNLLVSNGADIFLSNKAGYTPLDIYKKYGCNGCDAINDKTNSKIAKSQTIVVPSKYDSKWRRWLPFGGTKQKSKRAKTKHNKRNKSKRTKKHNKTRR